MQAVIVKMVKVCSSLCSKSSTKTDSDILLIAPLIVSGCEKFEIWFQSSIPVALSRFETKQFIRNLKQTRAPSMRFYILGLKFEAVRSNHLWDIVAHWSPPPLRNVLGKFVE